MRNLCLPLLFVISLLPFASAPALAIEAVRGKNYVLTKEHGPWMVMAASFHNVPEDRRDKNGISAEQAALELVYELREAGIPAYTYSQNAVVQKIQTRDRLGREDERVYAAQRDSICVLAGNWGDINDREGQKALTWIKKYQPRFVKKEKSGAIYRQVQGKGPLSGAFMTINPMLTPEEVAQKKRDPELVRLNAHAMFSLTGCKKKYSVQVASFAGRQSVQLKPDQFKERLDDSNAYGLNRAGEDATQLAAHLRRQNIEAYVYHDWYQSIVTVGSFDSPNDPVVMQIARRFGAEYREDPANPKEQKLLPHVEQLVVSNNRSVPPINWVFDWEPRIVRTTNGRPEMQVTTASR